MIGLTKLLCGTATVSEVLTHAERERAPARMLQFMKDRGPIVVWNVTRRCNLACVHCYYRSDAVAAGDELTRDEGLRLIDDLKAAKVPVLLLSGGEPLLREEVFAWGRAAADAGLRVALSTNGTLIDDATAAKIASAGFAYVGVSIDGMSGTHDALRPCSTSSKPKTSPASVSITSSTPVAAPRCAHATSRPESAGR